MSTERSYEGQELELFAAARNWKNYWSSKINPHVHGAVLEVGAGLGMNTPYLHRKEHPSWLCLEPDGALARHIPESVAGRPWADQVQVTVGMLRDLPATQRFDTLIYIDVLEHIEDDAAEMRDALAHLNPGGKIIVLSPARQEVFTEFDRAVGHFRRYDKNTLRACTPEGSKLVGLFYLDSCGLLASVANRLLLSQSIPTVKQIGLWDSYMVPVSRLTDPLIGFSIGKSLIGIWQKPS